MKNILVLTGSPRKEGNSSLIAETFIRAAKQSGHTVTRFDAGHKTIRPCIACDKCFSKGNPCVFNDSFNELAPLIEAADLILFSTPLYWFGFPAQLKSAIDKIYSLMVGERPVQDKETMLFVCGETDEMTDFDGIQRTYELTNRFLRWTDKGTLFIPNVNKPGDILQTNALEKAEKLGENL